MTCIVAIKDKNKTYIGGDSLGVGGNQGIERDDKKVFVSHGIAYGFTSSFRMGQILKYHTLKHVSNSKESDPLAFVVEALIPHYREILKEHGYAKTDNGEESGGVFALGFNGHLFVVYSDFQVMQSSHNYISVGSGESYALGALKIMEGTKLSPKVKIKKAINTASAFCTGVGGKTSIVSA